MPGRWSRRSSDEVHALRCRSAVEMLPSVAVTGAPTSVLAGLFRRRYAWRSRRRTSARSCRRCWSAPIRTATRDRCHHYWWPAPAPGRGFRGQARDRRAGAALVLGTVGEVPAGALPVLQVVASMAPVFVGAVQVTNSWWCCWR